MKNIFCLFALLLAAWHSAAAYDFMVDGIAYKKTLTKNTVAVTYTTESQPTSQNHSSYIGHYTIPPTVTYNKRQYTVIAIGDSAFWYCHDVASINIPNTVTTIGKSAFCDTRLTSIHIPESVMQIDISAFFLCTELASITTDANNPKYDSRNNCNAIIETSTNTLIQGCKNTVIPNTVTSIASNAFLTCTQLTSINIPNSVTTIDDYAFYGCNSLASVTLPESLTSIGNLAFGGSAALSQLISFRATPPAIQKLTFWEGATVYVPASAVDAYRNADFWKNLNILPMVFAVNGIYYKITSDNTVEVTYTTTQQPTSSNHSSYSGSIYIPPTITYRGITYYVTSIGEYAFYDCTGLTSITLPSKTLATIGASAFRGCTGLTSVKLNTGLQSIGEYAFCGCNKLTSINVPNTTTEIGKYAFSTCASLASVTFHSSLTTIGEGAFGGCLNLTSITLPESVTSIGNCAFMLCENLSTVISHNTTPPAIQALTFLAGDTITVYVPASAVKTYRQAEYWNKMKIMSLFGTIFAVNGIYYRITGDSTVETIARPEGKYSGDISIPATVSYSGKVYNVTAIGNNAFSQCHQLTSITLPESITTIGENAFYGCNILTSITIPSSVTKIDGNPFLFCYRLESIIVGSNNTHYDSRDNCNAIIETASNTLIMGCKNTIVPNTVTIISPRAFYYQGIGSVDFPNTVTTIGQDAFYECANLRSITIPESVTSIYSNPFQYTALESITVNSNNPVYDSRDNCNAIIETASNTLIVGSVNTIIPYTVTKIGQDAFRGIFVTSITLPSSIITIGENAFKYCQGLNKVTSLNTTPPIIHANTFDEIYAEFITVYVPASAVEAYRKADYWKDLYIHPLPSALPGDVDGDGVADITDINCITNVILGNEPASKYEGRADVNEDGNVDIDDLNIIIDTILGN